jgi:hypothetical protein
VIVEIRTYRLTPGSTGEFVRVMQDEAIPMLKQAGIRVVASGASLTAEGGEEEAYLVRAFESLEQHEEQEANFYESEAWRNGPREAIVSLIESLHSITVELSAEAVDALERG